MWENLSFGKSGKYFGAVFICYVLMATFLIWLFIRILPDNHNHDDMLDVNWVEYFVAAAILYVVVECIRVIYGLYFVLTVIQRVSISDNDVLAMKTFGVAEYRVKSIFDVTNDVQNKSLPVYNFLFAKGSVDRIHVCITCDQGDLYTVATHDNYEKLMLMLEKNIVNKEDGARVHSSTEGVD